MRSTRLGTACPTAGGFSSSAVRRSPSPQPLASTRKGYSPSRSARLMRAEFSNGPVLPEITADLLGATLINFSFGGAQALGTLPFVMIAGSVIPDQVLAAIAALPPEVRAPIEAVFGHNINLSGQVADLVAATSAQPPSADSALVSLIGLNDLRGLVATFDPGDPADLIGALQAGRGDRSGQSCRRPHRLRPWDRHGHLRDAARGQFLPDRQRASARTPGDRRCRGRRRQPGAPGRRARAAPAGP